jgi:FkbM family methyltransferase
LLDRKPLEATVDGLVLRGSVRHRAFLAAMRAGRESFMAELVAGSLRPGMVALDVGACVGYFTLVAARAVGDSGRVYAFEPNPHSYRFLVENLRRNGLAHRVVPLEAAASDREGTAIFWDDDVTASSSSLFERDSRARRLTVACTTVDAEVDSSSSVGLVKIDAEGAELQVLGGMGTVLSEAPPELRLFVECNPGALRRAGAGADELIAALGEAGFSCRAIDEEQRRLTAPDAALARADYVNLLCERAT